MFFQATFLILIVFAGYAFGGGISHTTVDGRSTCTVIANGAQQDDTPNIIQAFNDCGNNGHVIFPENQTYWIATKLSPYVNILLLERSKP